MLKSISCLYMKPSTSPIGKTIFSFTSLPAPSVHLTWAFLYSLSLHFTNQIPLWTLSANHVCAVSCHFRHLYDPPPHYPPPAVHLVVLLTRINSPADRTPGSSSFITTTIGLTKLTPSQGSLFYTQLDQLPKYNFITMESNRQKRSHSLWLKCFFFFFFLTFKTP